MSSLHRALQRAAVVVLAGVAACSAPAAPRLVQLPPPSPQLVDAGCERAAFELPLRPDGSVVRAAVAADGGVWVCGAVRATHQGQFVFLNRGLAVLGVGRYWIGE